MPIVLLRLRTNPTRGRCTYLQALRAHVQPREEAMSAMIIAAGVATLFILVMLAELVACTLLLWHGRRDP